MNLSKLYQEFFNSEKTGGLLLILCTVFSLVLANSFFGENYTKIWNLEAGGHSIVHWINDALMAVFFLLIGLELEREIYKGELSGLNKALLPAFAAVGGMLVPALIHLSLNMGTSFQAGAGIPMATDIAFAIGILSLCGSRIPASLKIFLTALAVIDDLGAILIIAFVYSKGIVWKYLALSMGIFALLLILSRLRVKSLAVYLAGGVIMWYFMAKSGIHATITGVLLAFAIPFRNGGEQSPSYKLQHLLHKPVAYFILPLFALANSCIRFDGMNWADLHSANSVGIILGLTLGKPAGVIVFTIIAMVTGLSRLPEELNLKFITGAGMLAGIGFTMSIFITMLAFENPSAIDISKISVILGSLISGIAGFLFLNFATRKRQ